MKSPHRVVLGYFNFCNPALLWSTGCPQRSGATKFMMTGSSLCLRKPHAGVLLASGPAWVQTYFFLLSFTACAMMILTLNFTMRLIKPKGMGSSKGNLTVAFAPP